MARALRGARDSRAERADRQRRRPPNLIRVMPAEEGVSDEIVVVVVGRRAAGPSCGAGRAARRSRDRGRLRARARARARPRRRRRGRRLRLRRRRRRVAVAEAAGARVERHPHEKDATDLELALDVAAAHGAASASSCSAGTADGSTTSSPTLLLLGLAPVRATSRSTRSSATRACTSSAATRALDGERRRARHAARRCTGRRTGVHDRGARVPARGETLEPGSSRGVSNELRDADRARVSLERGVLLAIVVARGDR